MEKSSWFNNLSRFFIPPDQGEHPLVRMSRIGADGLIQNSAHLPPTVQRARRTWSTVQEERERQKREEIYGRKLLGMVIPKIGERPFEKMNMLQRVIQQHQGPVVPSAISINQPFDTGSLSSLNVGSVVPDGIYHDKKEPYTVPEAEAQMPLGVGNHPPLPNAQEINQLTPIEEATSTQPSQTSPVDTRTGFEKFVESDFYKKLQDLFAGMSAAPSGGSGWDTLASGVKHLNEGDKQRGQVNQTVEYLKSKGYSEEEAAIMARNPQMLNGLFTQGMNARSSSQQIDNTPPKFSPDYYGVFNPETKQWEAKVTKGSKTYEEKKEKLTKQKQFFKSELVSQNTNIRLLENTEKLVRSTLTGINILAPIFSILSSTDASILKSNIEAVRKNLARDTLEEMKQKSPNGASGYGNMNIQEFTSLQTRLGNLDTNLRRDILLEEIIAVKEAVLKARSNTQKLLNNLNTEYNHFLSLPILPISQFTHVKNKDDEDRLSKGEMFVDDGGYIRNK
ncbi:hypothetical protein [Bartonella sp. AU18XJBT]|uniref:hypothetical protein n=1 Tax=Bartonella sp. AU18XJBT TaxID=3019089 RepID=UPI0023610DD0|nr:hypothetical protein [Bartonella sp. AU18XJBT]